MINVDFDMNANRIFNDVKIAVLSGIAKYREGSNEIWWQFGSYRDFTVEFINDKRTIVRWYWENGNLNLEEEYLNGRFTGSAKSYFADGVMSCEWKIDEETCKLTMKPIDV